MAAQMKLNVARGFKLGTRRNAINVPPQLRIKVKTGIAWVDLALGGGLTPSTSLMLTGMPGAGKSTLFRQLADSFSANPDVVVVYNTGEESLYQVQVSCERLQLQHDFMVGEETMAPTLIAFLKDLQKKNPKKHVVLLQDSLQTLDDGKYKDGGKTGNTAVRATQQLTDWAKETYGIVCFIGQCTKNGDFAGKNTIKHAIDAHAILAFDEDKKSPTYGKLLLEVPKNRWGCSGMTIIIDITPTGLKDTGCFSNLHQPKLDEEDEDESGAETVN